jgi:hypothetical protein
LGVIYGQIGKLELHVEHGKTTHLLLCTWNNYQFLTFAPTSSILFPFGLHQYWATCITLPKMVARVARVRLGEFCSAAEKTIFGRATSISVASRQAVECLWKARVICSKMEGGGSKRVATPETARVT